MSNIKQKAMDFVEKNEKPIKRVVKTVKVVGGVVAVTYCVAGVYVTGVRHGFHGAIRWFDKTFEEVELQKLWDTWCEANPDKLR